MYLYVIDTTIIKKNSNVIAQVKSLSKHYGIEGSFIYLSILHDIKKEILANCKEKSNTIIVVGNCDSLNKVIDVVFQLGRVDDTVFGFIPMENDVMSKIFGMNGSIDKDMLTISQRLNKKIDICCVNNKYFLDRIVFNFSYGFNIEIDASYVVGFKSVSEIVVGSLFFDYSIGELSRGDDGFFDVAIYSSVKKNKKDLAGRLKARKLNINSKTGIKYSINNVQYKANNIQIDIVWKKIKIILSKSSILNDM